MPRAPCCLIHHGPREQSQEAQDQKRLQPWLPPLELATSPPLAPRPCAFLPQPLEPGGSHTPPHNSTSAQVAETTAPFN